MKTKIFDINEAKAGAEVCTRDGRKVRILCFDLKGTNRPICAAVTAGSEKEYEYTIQYFEDGRVCKRYVPDDNNGRRLLIEERPEDLMMVNCSENPNS